jgi:hypothetical protein
MRILCAIVEPTADMCRSATPISFIAAEYARSPSVTMLLSPSPSREISR